MKVRSLVAVSVALVGLVSTAWLLAGRDEPPADALSVASDPLEGDRPPAREGLPHVVLVIGCTLRKDQLEVYGGPEGLGTHLTALASEGALFEDAIAAAPWTKASATALLTGRHALQIGMVEPSSDRNHRRLAPDVTTLAEHLRAAGYRTLGATANPNLHAVFGFEQGFDAYVQLDRLWRHGMQKLGADALVPAMLRELDRLPDDGRPRYMQVMLVDAHAPYAEGPVDAMMWAEPGAPRRVWRYRAALEGFDRGLATLEVALAERGLTADNTVFVVVSDHGEGLSWPEHHGKAHGAFLAPSTVEAVWVARGPGVGRGVRIDGVASGVDVVPTLLGLLDLPGAGGPGVDHSALLATGGTTSRRRAFTDTWFIDANRAAVYTSERACQRDFHPFGRGGHFPDGCFDRAADPLHERPLRDDALEAELVDWRARMLLEAGTGRDAEPSADVDAQLEALGYLD